MNIFDIGKGSLVVTLAFLQGYDPVVLYRLGREPEEHSHQESHSPGQQPKPTTQINSLNLAANNTNNGPSIVISPLEMPNANQYFGDVSLGDG
jgi:hypothetical protein